MMNRYFVETNAYNMVAFVDDSGKAYVYDENAFPQELTLEVAQATQYENIDGAKTAEEAAAMQGTGEVYDWAEIERDADRVTEF